MASFSIDSSYEKHYCKRRWQEQTLDQIPQVYYFNKHNDFQENPSTKDTKLYISIQQQSSSGFQ